MGAGASSLAPVPEVLNLGTVTLLAEEHGYDVGVITKRFQELSVSL
jgi:hypothetical protein